MRQGLMAPPQTGALPPWIQMPAPDRVGRIDGLMFHYSVMVDRVDTGSRYRWPRARGPG